MPLAEKPPRPAPSDKQPKNGRSITVKTGQTWSTLAKDLSITPWDLIDFNFPGIKDTFALNFQLATRHVNWYLREYVGCTATNGPNYKFSSDIRGGQGVFRNGTIFLPPKPYLPPAPAVCVAIDVPHVTLPWQVNLVLNQAGVSLPTRARCLWQLSEIDEAKKVFGDSLHYHQIYISDGSGGQDRACTVAIPLDGVWIVILNVGRKAYMEPGSDKETLIHELVHAWQSQHHSRPWQFMVNCLESQAAARAASLASKPVVNSLISVVTNLNLPALGDADAYSYVPGKQFGEYAGEQIAQQVEDSYRIYYRVPARAKPEIARIAQYISLVPAGKHDDQNVMSLSAVRFAYEKEPNVVWHD